MRIGNLDITIAKKDYKIDDATFAEIEKFVYRGVYPRGFVMGILSKNLELTLTYAYSEMKIEDLLEIMKFCFHELPSVCWGSRKAVNAWVDFCQRARGGK